MHKIHARKETKTKLHQKKFLHSTWKRQDIRFLSPLCKIKKIFFPSWHEYHGSDWLVEAVQRMDDRERLPIGWFIEKEKNCTCNLGLIIVEEYVYLCVFDVWHSLQSIFAERQFFSAVWFLSTKSFHQKNTFFFTDTNHCSTDTQICYYKYKTFSQSDNTFGTNLTL